jgi:hypothetical protein
VNQKTNFFNSTSSLWISQRGWKIFLIAWLTLLIAVWNFPIVFSLCHAFINIFAGGRSEVKTWLFLAYLSSLIIATLLIRRRRFPTVKIFRDIFAATIGVGLLLNLFGFALFITNYGLKINDRITVFAGGEVSSNSLAHVHIMKGSIGLILSGIGLSSFENMDGGQAYLGLMPQWLLWCGVAMMVMALISLWLYYIFVRTRDESKVGFASIMAFALVSFCLIKNMFDGGPLNPEAVIGVAFLIVMLYPHRMTRIFSIALVLGYVLGVIILSPFGSAHLLDFDFNETLHGIFRMMAFALVMLPLYRREMIGRWDRPGVLLVILAITFLFIPLSRDLQIIRYRTTSIDFRDWAILGIYDNIDDAEFEHIGRVGDLNYYEVKPEKAITAGEIIDRYRLLDNYYPLSFPYRNCFPRGLERIYEFDLLTPDELNFEGWHNTSVRFLKVELIGEDKGINRYSINLAIRPCLTRPVNVVQETWAELSIDPAIVVNIKQKSNR